MRPVAQRQSVMHLGSSEKRSNTKLSTEDVAQLAERRPVEANVAGSFPVILPQK